MQSELCAPEQCVLYKYYTIRSIVCEASCHLGLLGHSAHLGHLGPLDHLGHSGHWGHLGHLGLSGHLVHHVIKAPKVIIPLLFIFIVTY